jgi:hydroxyacylglutathione hydrolase
MSNDIRKITVGKWKENSYCIYIDNQAVIIDPGDEYNVLKKEFEKSYFNFHSILLTHGHFDHIGAVHDFQSEFSVPTYLHSKDKRIANQANLFRNFAGDDTIVKTPKIDFFIDEVFDFSVNGKIFEFHHTPGHSLGSVCIVLDNNLFCGDVILEDVIGRTDLPGGNYDSLVQSVNYIIEKFENFDVYPGHGNPFVLNHEVIDKFKKQLK